MTTAVTYIARYEEDMRAIARLRELPNSQTPAGKAVLDDWEASVRTKLDRLYRDDLQLAKDTLTMLQNQSRPLRDQRIANWKAYKADLEDKLTVLGLTAELDAIGAPK